MSKGNNVSHDTRIAAAIEKLRLPEFGLQVVDMPVESGGTVISLVGVKDINEERSLGDYQNMTYFLLRPEGKAVVVDPGIREGHMIREMLGIESCDVIFTHFHLDHWIGYEPYIGENFYASQVCKMVLKQMVGIERTGKSIFMEGRLTDHHRRATPVRAVNDAERLLPVKEKIIGVGGDNVYRNPSMNLEFFELPYGQTEGTLYGVLETPDTKIVFAGDLFVIINGRLRVEPHYAFKSKEAVIADITVALKALLGKDTGREDHPKNCREHISKLAVPDKIALGHGFINFEETREDIEHLLCELEELIRIEREHII